MTKRPPKAFKYQQKVIVFYGDETTLAIIQSTQDRTGENRSELLRRIVYEWNEIVPEENPTNDRPIGTLESAG